MVECNDVVIYFSLSFFLFSLLLLLLRNFAPYKNLGTRSRLDRSVELQYKCLNSDLVE